MLSQLVQVRAEQHVSLRVSVGLDGLIDQAAAGRISVVAAAGINASCALDVVRACTPQSLPLPVAAPVWIHMSGSALSPTAADSSLPYCPLPFVLVLNAPAHAHPLHTHDRFWLHI